MHAQTAENRKPNAFVGGVWRVKDNNKDRPTKAITGGKADTKVEEEPKDETSGS